MAGCSAILLSSVREKSFSDTRAGLPTRSTLTPVSASFSLNRSTAVLLGATTRDLAFVAAQQRADGGHQRRRLTGTGRSVNDRQVFGGEYPLHGRSLGGI